MSPMRSHDPAALHAPPGRRRAAGALCAAALLALVAPAPAARAAKDVASFVNDRERDCFRLLDAHGAPASGALWTIDVMGGVRELGSFTGAGCIEINVLDQTLRADVRDDDVFTVISVTPLPGSGRPPRKPED